MQGFAGCSVFSLHSITMRPVSRTLKLFSRRKTFSVTTCVSPLHLLNECPVAKDTSQVFAQRWTLVDTPPRSQTAVQQAPVLVHPAKRHSKTWKRFHPRLTLFLVVSGVVALVDNAWSTPKPGSSIEPTFFAT